MQNKSIQQINQSNPKRRREVESGQQLSTAERLAGDWVTCLCAVIGPWVVVGCFFSGGGTNSPEQRAAKRGVFTGCQFGWHEPTLWVRVFITDKAVWGQFTCCRGNLGWTEGKERTRCLPHLRRLGRPERRAGDKGQRRRSRRCRSVADENV